MTECVYHWFTHIIMVGVFHGKSGKNTESDGEPEGEGLWPAGASVCVCARLFPHLCVCACTSPCLCYPSHMRSQHTGKRECLGKSEVFYSLAFFLRFLNYSQRISGVLLDERFVMLFKSKPIKKTLLHLSLFVHYLIVSDQYS